MRHRWLNVLVLLAVLLGALPAAVIAASSADSVQLPPAALLNSNNPQQGYLHGTVAGNRTLGGENFPLKDASVGLYANTPGGPSFQTTTDANGCYEIYLEADQAGAYTVGIAGPPGKLRYFPITTTLEIGQGDSLEYKAVLRLAGSLLRADPENISETLGWQGSQTDDLVVGNPNPATLPLSADIVEVAGYFQPATVLTVKVDQAAAQARPFEAGKPVPLSGSTAQPAGAHDVRIDKLSQGQIKVLIVSPDWANVGSIGELDQVLNAYPDVQADIYPMIAEPALAALQPYNVVVIGGQYPWEPFNHDTMGNLLADYVDQGGKVIQLFGTIFGGTPYGPGFHWSLGGRWRDQNYSPMTYASYYSLGQRALGSYQAGHPLMDGVQVISDGSLYGGDVTVRPDAEAVASYDNGVPYIAARSNKIVAINETLTYGATWLGDVDILLHNALLCLVPSDIPWLSESQNRFDLPVGRQATTQVTLSANVLQVDQPGSYNAWLWFRNNDPLQDGAYVPVRMTVEPAPDMAQLSGAITSDRPGGPLFADVEISGPAGTLNMPHVSHYAHWFRAAQAGTYHMRVVSAGYTTQEADVEVTAAAPAGRDFELKLAAAWIHASPVALEVTLLSGHTATETMTLNNLGQRDLTFEINEVPSSKPLPPTSALRTALAPMVIDSAPVEIERRLQIQLAQGRADFWIKLRQGVRLAGTDAIGDWNARGWYVYNSLKAVADNSQGAVKNYLDRHGAHYEAYWINNSLLVRGGSEQMVRDLAAMPEVRLLRSEHYQPLTGAPTSLTWVNALPVYGQVQWAGTAWGLTFIRADKVWNELGVRGAGVVVANLDTGVQWDHPALKDAYRGWDGATADHNYNWFAPTDAARAACPGAATAPCDWAGHGSFTMGTMVGYDKDPSADGHRTGVAPAARWMAAMGCDTPPNQCSDAALTASAQWFVAPTDLAGNNPDPGKRPHVINNSWGGVSDSWYLSYVQAWRAAGIFPAFSIGNTGPSCSTAGSPGDYAESFASGAVDNAGVIASFSSRGPGLIAGVDLKPNLAAPGVNICSSVPGSNYDCTLSGTSMASPHTAGTVALLWSANPALKGDFTATFNLLQDNANHSTPTGSCGAPAGLQASYTYGYGWLDAYAVVSQGAPTDIAWVSAEPVSATIPTAGSLPIGVTFDATGLAAGVYTGTLIVNHNDPLSGRVAVPLTLTVIANNVELTPAALSAIVAPGQTHAYTLSVKNIAAASDSFDVAVSGGWGASNPGIIPDLAAGATTEIQVSITVPEGAMAGDESTNTMRVTSVSDPTKRALATLTTSAAVVARLEAAVVGAGAHLARPGVPAQYTVTVTNRGNAPDTFAISKVGVWPATVSTTTGELAPGDSAALTLSVTAPAGAAPGDHETTAITATSANDAAVHGTVNVMTTVVSPVSYLPLLGNPLQP